jgi:hypothetical protein
MASEFSSTGSGFGAFLSSFLKARQAFHVVQALEDLNVLLLTARLIVAANDTLHASSLPVVLFVRGFSDSNLGPRARSTCCECLSLDGGFLASGSGAGLIFTIRQNLR